MGRTSDANERLMGAALELIWEQSYGAVTIDDICKRADVKKGSFYYFFKSKSALVVAALQHLWDTVGQPAYETHFSPAVAPLQRITNFLEWVQRLQREKREQVGYVLGSTYTHLTGGGEERSAHTDYIGVRADQRKRGIGEFLLRKSWLAALRRGPTSPPTCGFRFSIFCRLQRHCPIPAILLGEIPFHRRPVIDSSFKLSNDFLEFHRDSVRIEALLRV